MGQKVWPLGFRVGITENWRSRWYAPKAEFGGLLVEDSKIREFIKKNFRFAGIPKIEIERDRESVTVILHTARPGVIIGRKGAKVDKLKTDLEGLTKRKVNLNIQEVPVPELDAQLVSESIAEQLEKRASFRRVMKNAMRIARERGAQGVKVTVSGRLGGAEMARTVSFNEGKIPLQTLMANVALGMATAVTTYGAIGVKVWIYCGQYEVGRQGHGAHAKKG